MFFFLFFGIYLRRLCFPLSSTMTATGRSASESWERPWRSWWASSSTTARSTRSCETSTWTGTDRWTSRVSASVFMVLWWVTQTLLWVFLFEDVCSIELKSEETHGEVRPPYNDSLFSSRVCANDVPLTCKETPVKSTHQKDQTAHCYCSSKTSWCLYFLFRYLQNLLSARKPFNV